MSTSKYYDEKYGSEVYFWGKKPSTMCYKVLQILPPERSLNWLTGEIFTHYHDWKIKFCTEEILDYLSGETPCQFAVNRIIAMKPTA